MDSYESHVCGAYGPVKRALALPSRWLQSRSDNRYSRRCFNDKEDRTMMQLWQGLELVESLCLFVIGRVLGTRCGNAS
jgi:hypothetical protein